MVRTLLDEPVVMYRTEAGEVVALGDVCPHRRAPLHLGKLHGDAIACPYHGLRFDPTGACVHNPNFNNPPPRVKTAVYQVVEKDDMVWIWMGAGEGDSSTILSFAEVVPSSTMQTVRGYLKIEAPEPLITDNLLDLSHAEFLHPFLAYEGINTRFTERFRQEGDTVYSHYEMKDAPLTALISALWEGDPIERCDMRVIQRWDPPSCFKFEQVATIPGGHADEGVTLLGSNHLTPETETSTHYFWAAARNTRLDDKEFHEQMQINIGLAFMNEDAPILEWQQRYSNCPTPVPIHPQLLRGDAGGARARRIADRIRASEQLQKAQR